MKCHICKSVLFEAQNYESLTRSASDCSPWKAGGRIGVCKACGIVQKVINDAWHADTAEIYSKYDIYHQSPTHKEQPIFIASKNEWVPRSQVLLRYFLDSCDALPSGSKIMDIGCGNGATLHAMAQIMPEAQRYGYDPTATNMTALEARTDLGLTACSNSISELPKSFDMLTMVHVLEHIPNALEVLQEYVQMLTVNGYFVIAVPNFLENPFDITIADHCSHFCPETLQNLLRAAGLEVCKISTTALPKEILVIAKRADTSAALRINQKLIDKNIATLQGQISWLHNINKEVADLVQKPGRFGVFGTSIAANWFYGAWSNHIKFFVDEDPDGSGTMYRDIPVVTIADLKASDTVYISLAHQIAVRIQQRYQAATCKIYITPELKVEYADAASIP